MVCQLLGAALGPFLAEARLHLTELVALLPPLSQDPEPVPFARTVGLPFWAVTLQVSAPRELCPLGWGRKEPCLGGVLSGDFPLQLQRWELLHHSLWGQVSGSQRPVDTSLGPREAFACSDAITGGVDTRWLGEAPPRGHRATGPCCLHLSPRLLMELLEAPLQRPQDLHTCPT